MSVWNSYFLDPAGCPVALSDHLRRRSAKPNPVQLLFPFSFSCADIFILLLKLLRAHYLRGRNVALIVWWLQCFGPFFSVCNQPARASCLMPVWSREGRRVTAPQHGPWTMSPSFHFPRHSEQTVSPWHAFHHSSPFVSDSPLHGSQLCGEEHVASLDLLFEDHRSWPLSRSTHVNLFCTVPHVTVNLSIVCFPCVRRFWLRKNRA